MGGPGWGGDRQCLGGGRGQTDARGGARGGDRVQVRERGGRAGGLKGGRNSAQVGEEG